MKPVSGLNAPIRDHLQVGQRARCRASTRQARRALAGGTTRVAGEDAVDERAAVGHGRGGRGRHAVLHVGWWASGQRPARARAGGAAMVLPRQRARGACGRHDQSGWGPLPTRRRYNRRSRGSFVAANRPTRSPDAPALTPVRTSRRWRAAPRRDPGRRLGDRPLPREPGRRHDRRRGRHGAHRAQARATGQVVSTDRPGTELRLHARDAIGLDRAERHAGSGRDLRRGDARARRAGGGRARHMAGRGAPRQR